MNNVNIPLLRKAVEWADAEHAKSQNENDDAVCMWRQMVWNEATSCGTAYCIAGYVGQLVEPAFAHAEIVDFTGTTPRPRPTTYKDNFHRRYEKTYDMKAPDETHVSAFAMQQLGLTCMQAEALFSGSNGIDDIHRAASEIAGEPI